MTHYVVTADGAVRKYTAKSVAMAMIAQLGDKAYYATDTDLKALPSPVLVALYNKIQEGTPKFKPVARFADRATAEKRLAGVLEVLAKPGEAPTTVEGETRDATTAQGSTETTAEVEPELTEEEETEETQLDELPLTPEEFTPDPTKTDEENTEMATKAKNARNATRRAAKKGAKKSTAKKTGAKRTPVVSIPESTVRRVIKMREDGKGWPEILKAIGEGKNFVLRVRPLMKKIAKSSVKALGPGSANYGKAAKKGKGK